LGAPFVERLVRGEQGVDLACERSRSEEIFTLLRVLLPRPLLGWQPVLRQDGAEQDGQRGERGGGRPPHVAAVHAAEQGDTPARADRQRGQPELEVVREEAPWQRYGEMRAQEERGEQQDLPPPAGAP